MGVGAPSSSVHLSASPGWQQQSKLIFQGSEIAIVSSEPYQAHPPQQCPAHSICLLCLCLGSALFSWSERYFCFTLVQYGCFFYTRSWVVACYAVLALESRDCCWGWEEKLVSVVFSCHWNLIAVGACWYYDKNICPIVISLRPSAITDICKVVISNHSSTLWLIGQKDFAWQQRMRIPFQNPEAEMQRSSSLIVPLRQHIVPDLALKSTSSRATGGQVWDVQKIQT